MFRIIGLERSKGSMDAAHARRYFGVSALRSGLHPICLATVWGRIRIAFPFNSGGDLRLCPKKIQLCTARGIVCPRLVFVALPRLSPDADPLDDLLRGFDHLLAVFLCRL